jgi:hypothetical protein
MSGKSSRAKGARYENRVRNYFTEKGFKVTNPNRSGYDGDDLKFAEFPWLSGECKDQKTMALSAWVAQAEENAPEDGIAFVIHHKVRNGNIGKDYVTLTAEDFSRLLELLRPW